MSPAGPRDVGRRLRHRRDRRVTSRAETGLRVYIGITGLLVIATLTTAITTSGILPRRPGRWPTATCATPGWCRRSEISAANVGQLGVAWTMPLTASSIYGTFAANPVTSAHGVGLPAGSRLERLRGRPEDRATSSGRAPTTRRTSARTASPYADGKVYGATAKFAFALDAKTGKEVWRNATLVPKRAAEGRRRARERVRHRHPAAGRERERLPLVGGAARTAASSTRSTRTPARRCGRSTR